MRLLVKIQSNFRGYLARRQVNEIRTEMYKMGQSSQFQRGDGYIGRAAEIRE
jgi:hypothetical protein